MDFQCFLCIALSLQVDGCERCLHCMSQSVGKGTDLVRASAWQSSSGQIWSQTSASSDQHSKEGAALGFPDVCKTQLKIEFRGPHTLSCEQQSKALMYTFTREKGHNHPAFSEAKDMQSLLLGEEGCSKAEKTGSYYSVYTGLIK